MNGLVLNQIGISDRNASTPAGGVPKQTLTFDFLDPSGTPIPVENLTVQIGDISSAWDNMTRYASTGFRDQYWDAVGFTQAPTSITPDSQNAGTGAGTIADPFQRTGNLRETRTGPWQDTFTFAAATSGLQMEYTNQMADRVYDRGYFGAAGEPLFGWQGITLLGFTFDAAC